MEIIFIGIVFWLIPILIAHAIGKPKHRAGALYGIFLGWVGVIAVALLPPKQAMTLEELERRKRSFTPYQYETIRAEILAERTSRECPHCKEQMRRDAAVCPHCQRESAAWTLHEGRWWSQANGQWLWLDEMQNAWQRPAI
jgi:hypothetical protein